MAALGSEHVMARAVPVETPFAESGAGGNDRLVSARAAGNRNHVVERHQVTGGERADAPPGGFEIIDQNCFVEVQFVGEALRFDDPRQVGSFDATVCDWPRDSKAGLRGFGVRRLHELCDDLVQPGIMSAGKDLNFGYFEFVILDIEEGQPRVGASNVAREDHFSKFLQCRPSRSSSSSASLGPQLPAG